MKTLIIEFRHGGHYPEYLKHILNRIKEDGCHDDFILFLTPFLKESIIDFVYTPLYSSIHFFDSSTINEYNECNTGKQRANFIYKQIERIKSVHLFNHVLFLNLNMVLRNFSLIYPLKKLSFQYSGIFFQSPYRLRKSNKFSFSLIKREAIIRLLAINKNCKAIYILNDKKGVDFYSKWSDKIKFIPDPVNITTASTLNIYNFHNIDRHKISFLHIGALGKYKGTQEVISAIENIGPKLKDNVHFLAIGRMDKELESFLQKLNQGYVKPMVSIRNEYISDEDFTAYVEQSSVIVIANRNVESSSGILNHSLSKNKVIIAPDLGYYKEALENYEGVVFFVGKSGLNDAIEKTFHNLSNLERGASKFDANNYIELHSSNRFSKILLK